MVRQNRDFLYRGSTVHGGLTGRIHSLVVSNMMRDVPLLPISHQPKLASGTRQMVEQLKPRSTKPTYLTRRTTVYFHFNTHNGGDHTYPLHTRSKVPLTCRIKSRNKWGRQRPKAERPHIGRPLRKTASAQSRSNFSAFSSHTQLYLNFPSWNLNSIETVCRWNGSKRV